MQQFNFQVNLGGMIDILSNHLYSEEKVFIREMLQNATDAISARRRLSPDLQGQVVVEIIPPEEDRPGQLLFEDNGIGLTENEIHQFLSSIGSSSKREDLSVRRQEFIGQFGIGLLSCFMITDEIVMVTCSAKDGKAIEWRGQANGLYSVRHLTGDYEPGTRVFLTAKEGKNRYFQPDKVLEALTYYGNLLPYPIFTQIGEVRERLNQNLPPWEQKFESAEQEKEAYLQFGKSHFEMTFFDYVPLQSNIGDVKGAAFLLPHNINPVSKTGHKVYLKRMLVSENVQNMLPEWAFFVRCVINTNTLRPTASRESFYEDASLNQTRRQLGNLLKQYLIGLDKSDPKKLRELYLIHYHAMNSLALYDEEFFRIIIPYIPFETNRGEMTLNEIEASGSPIRHVSSIDDFRQIAGIASAQGILLINSGYTYKVELLERFAELFPKKSVDQMNVNDFIDAFEDLQLEEEILVSDFIGLADEALAEFNCTSAIKKFEPSTIHSLYSKSDLSFLEARPNLEDEESNQLWESILDSLSSEVKNSTAKLCFNFANPVVKRLLKVQDVEKLKLYIQLMYIQALLLGHYPLETKELNMLSKGLTDMIDMGLA